jgi:2-polyprenyl-3-methyl-5-hydroxy-6-metoxy-1,4-benzoquinol methylase
MSLNNFKEPIKPVIQFSQLQIDHRDKIYDSIKRGDLVFEESKCFCGERDAKEIVAFDAWGINIPTVKCNKCNAIRSKYFMDDISIAKFYNNGFYYAHMFTKSNNTSGVGIELEEYFKEEVSKGWAIKSWIEDRASLLNIKNVLEVGCGCGGILHAFSNNKYKCVGIDYNQEYIEYGKSKLKDIELNVGGLNCQKGKKFDLIILSDLVEHLNDPLNFLINLRDSMTSDGILYVNVPGYYGISNRRFGNNIRQFTKIEHLWCFTLKSLKNLLSMAGYTYISGTQEVRALFRIKKIEVNNLKVFKDSTLHLYFFNNFSWFRNINYYCTRTIEKSLGLMGVRF